MKKRDWYGLHRERWGDEIVPDALLHPAKFSRGLIRKMYRHALRMSWVKPGDFVLDPFAGVALGALDAMCNGLVWTGVELEERFYNLGLQNIERWRERYERMWPSRWGLAFILNGDSRALDKILLNASLLVSSPPYGQTLQGGEGPGARYDFKYHLPDNAQKKSSLPDYGNSDGQLAQMPHGDYNAVVSSPPYRGKRDDGGMVPTRHYGGRSQYRTGKFYGDGEGQLGTMEQGDQDNVDQSASTFWSAARLIMSHSYDALSPGEVAMWVVKAYVKNKEIVDFPEQWRILGESVGFHTIEWIRSWLVEDRGAQYDLFGNYHVHTVERKSFFRQLYESKYPENRIDYEVVVVQRK